MILATRYRAGGSVVSVLVVLITSALVPVFALAEIKQIGAHQATRVAVENDAKLIESVAAHLSGVAQLQRVSRHKLEWKSPSNREWRHVQDAVKNFKNSQVLLSEALANTSFLVKQMEGEKKEQMQLKFQSLKARTADLASKNLAFIRSLESQQLPAIESMRDLTQSLLSVINYNIEVAQ